MIDLSFKRVAIDLLGPDTPANKKEHRYILTSVDYATRHPEAVPIKNIDMETVTEALLDMYSRVSVPKKVWDSARFQVYGRSFKAAINQTFDYYSIPSNLQWFN